MLNCLIDAPMEEILSELPIADDVKNALLTKEGRCGALYELVLSYEAADWEKINHYAEILGLSDNVLTSIYFLCMDNVDVLWEQLTHISPNQSTEL